MSNLETLPPHIRRPDLRPVQPIPVVKNGQQFFALRDPAMQQQQTMVVPAQALVILQQFKGQRPIDEIAGQFQGNVDQFVELAQGLDRVGLLWGPTFEQMETELKAAIETNGAYSAGASASMGDDTDACRKRIDGYFEETEDPELPGKITGIVAPHLDYDRGWPNYAAAYYMLREAPPPDRVVVLGTNHFGMGDGVVLAEHGFDTPMGRCSTDQDVTGRLDEILGRPLTIDQLDHVGEHSVQLQLPWIKYCFQDIPVVAALIPDPLTPMIEDDNQRVDVASFVTALQTVLESLGGQTLVVASSDLSHVGPQFGEPRPVDEQRRVDVERHDRDMMSKFIAGDAEEFVAAMKWNKNPTRWCSIGNMTALLMLAEPSDVELIDYRQAFDERGVALVSSAAITLS